MIKCQANFLYYIINYSNFLYYIINYSNFFYKSKEIDNSFSNMKKINEILLRITKSNLEIADLNLDKKEILLKHKLDVLVSNRKKLKGSII